MGRGSYMSWQGLYFGWQGLLCSETTNSANFASAKFCVTEIFTVSGQNKIGRELTLLALIQPTVIKQQAVSNNWL